MSYKTFTPQIARALAAERARLIEIVDWAVQASFAAAKRHARRRPIEEPDKVLYFFSEALPAIRDYAAERLAKHRVKVEMAGVFTHQNPIVRFPGNAPRQPGCELADLAIFITYGGLAGTNPQMLGNALLLQAKERLSTGRRRSPQRRLYETVGSFAYQKPAALWRASAPCCAKTYLTGPTGDCVIKALCGHEQFTKDPQVQEPCIKLIATCGLFFDRNWTVP